MKLLALASFTVLSAVVATTALGSSQPPVVATPIAMATLRQPYSITVKKPSDVLVVKVRVAPGGSFGWHSHPSAVAVAIAWGTLTLYGSGDSGCAPKRYSRGQGFVEQPNHVHLARNEGTTPVILYATYLGLSQGASPNVPAKQPANCSV